MDPKLKHVPIIEWKGAEHAEANPDNIPPEGDQDHGRSGWGFQSRSRHEHFVRYHPFLSSLVFTLLTRLFWLHQTSPGEPEYEYDPDRGTSPAIPPFEDAVELPISSLPSPLTAPPLRPLLPLLPLLPSLVCCFFDRMDRMGHSHSKEVLLLLHPLLHRLENPPSKT